MDGCFDINESRELGQYLSKERFFYIFYSLDTHDFSSRFSTLKNEAAEDFGEVGKEGNLCVLARICNLLPYSLLLCLHKGKRILSILSSLSPARLSHCDRDFVKGFSSSINLSF